MISKYTCKDLYTYTYIFKVTYKKMARGLSSVSFSLIVISLLLSLMIINDFSPTAEARPLKSSRSNKDYFLFKENGVTVSKSEKSTTSTTSAPGPDGKPHRLQIGRTLKYEKKSGPAPGEGHKYVPASNQ